ncbi:hypothetical protein [Noviherbaspirillum humi]|uniref:hypothetical protein n=1 Tax=Noviherbaspirillum humi TaxID=1688639 RepID=UPI001160B517|nr:hypothetical protein [Noviherbaspirillum humi]
MTFEKTAIPSFCNDLRRALVDDASALWLEAIDILLSCGGTVKARSAARFAQALPVQAREGAPEGYFASSKKERKREFNLLWQGVSLVRPKSCLYLNLSSTKSFMLS